MFDNVLALARRTGQSGRVVRQEPAGSMPPPQTEVRFVARLKSLNRSLDARRGGRWVRWSVMALAIVGLNVWMAMTYHWSVVAGVIALVAYFVGGAVVA